MIGMGAIDLLWIDLNYCCIVVKVSLLFHIVVSSFNSISYFCKLLVLETLLPGKRKLLRLELIYFLNLG